MRALLYDRHVKCKMSRLSWQGSFASISWCSRSGKVLSVAHSGIVAQSNLSIIEYKIVCFIY